MEGRSPRCLLDTRAERPTSPTQIVISVLQTQSGPGSRVITFVDRAVPKSRGPPGTSGAEYTRQHMRVVMHRGSKR